MKKLFVIIITIAMVLITSSSFIQGQNQVTDSTATVIGYWRNGEKINLALTKEKVKYQNDQLISNVKLTYDAAVAVVDSTEHSYTLEWKFVNIKFADSTSKQLLKWLEGIPESLTVRYTTNELGTFTELLNWQEIKQMTDKFTDQIARKLDNPQITAMINQIKGKFSSKESIEQLAIKEIQLYHFPYGVEYQLSQKIEAETSLPNFLGGEPFPAVMTIEMTELKPEENFCKIKVHQTIEKEKTTKIVFDSIKKLVKEMGQQMPAEKDLPLITINDINEFEVELMSGWLTRAYTRREVQSDMIKQVDILEIKLRK